jgi:hypothetical protein
MKMTDFIAALAPWSMLLWGLGVPYVFCSLARARFVDAENAAVRRLEGVLSTVVKQLGDERERERQSFQTMREAAEKYSSGLHQENEKLRDRIAELDRASQ